jgi:hypothetical protein
MRAASLLAGLIFLSGCSRDHVLTQDHPLTRDLTLTREQTKGLEAIGKLQDGMQSGRRIAGNQRLQEYEETADQKSAQDGIAVGQMVLAMHDEYDRRKDADGAAKTDDWWDAETKKPLDELLKTWGPRQAETPQE